LLLLSQDNFSRADATLALPDCQISHNSLCSNEFCPKTTTSPTQEQIILPEAAMLSMRLAKNFQNFSADCFSQPFGCDFNRPPQSMRA
jgi:hypothetical protein